MNTIKKITHKTWPILTIIFVWLLFAKPYIVDGAMPFPSAYLVDFFPPWSYSYAHPVKNNAMPDVVNQLYPWKKAVVESWKNGAVPYWNPYQFAGNGLLANVQSAALTPLNLLFFILPFNRAWSYLIILQPLFAGIFMYLFLRALDNPRIPWSGAVLGSVSFMFCGFIVTWMAYGTLSYAALYLPLLLYGITIFLDRGAWRGAAVAACSIVLSVVSGHVQTSIYVVGMGIIYGVWKLLTNRQHTSIPSMLGLAGAISAGIVLSLYQILPAIDLYQQSVRSALFGKGGEVIPWNYLVTFIAPDFFGNPVTRNDWFGHYAEWAGFAGVVAFILACIAVFYRWSLQPIRFWVITLVGTIILSYSLTAVGIVTVLKIPVLSTSAASRIVVITSFSIAVLSAYGMRAVTEYWRDQSTAAIRRLFVGIGILTVAIWLLLLVGNLLFVQGADAEKLAVARRNFILPTLLVFGSLGLIVSVGRLRGSYRKHGITIGIVVLILVSAFDSLRFAEKWMPADPTEYMYPSLPVIEYIQEHGGYHRVYGNMDNAMHGVFGIYGIEGYDPLYVDRYGTFIASLADGRLKTPERSVVQVEHAGDYTQDAFNLLGVKYIMHAKADARSPWAYPYWEHEEYRIDPVYADEQYEVFLNEGAYPRAFLVYDAQVAGDDQEILDRMFSAQTNLRETLVLERDPQIDFGTCAGTRAEDTAVDIVRYTPAEIRIAVTSPCAGLLFLSDTHYPDWRVYVNGAQSDLLRANFAFRAVAVPAGYSVVDFRYDNRYL